MQKTLNLILLFLFPTIFLQGQDSGTNLFDNSYVHEVKIYFDDPNFWETLVFNYDNGIYSGDFEYLEAPSVYIDGTLIETVGVRHKGFSSYFASNEFKKSLKLDFDQFIEDQEYDGLRKVNLNNGVGDPAFLRDLLCYDMIRETGAPAPRVSHTRVYINDEYWGLYVLVEQIDKTFLSENFDDNDGNLFKNKGWSSLEWLGNNVNEYKENFDLKTNETEDDWTGFIELHDVINNSSNSEFQEEIQRIFDVPNYLKILAIDVATNNWDSYIEHGRNFYLYQAPDDGKFHWIPWDYNLAMGGDFSTFGSPEVLDTLCPFFAGFSMDVNYPQVSFVDESTEVPESWFWDFGDGSTSDLQNPDYTYTAEGIFTVCLTMTKTYPSGLCTKTHCDELDFSMAYADCPSLLDGSCPYEPTDQTLIQVMEVVDFCCNSWEYDCQGIYDFFYSDDGGQGFGWDFPLIINNPQKVLIDRLMEVDDFQDLYLSYVCDMLDNNFTTDRIYPIIDNQSSIIRDAVYEDPNYIFTTNHFEYDISYGGQANGTTIPQLKVFVEDRIPKLEIDLDNTNYDCSPASSPISFMDIVINEIVADNDSTSAITDSNGEYDDWIEIYNNTNTTIELSGFYLSDDSSTPQKWAFPLGTMIEADGYLIVWADNQGAQTGLHANFQLDKSGEQVQLIHQDGTVIDALSFGEQQTNQGFARLPNGTGEFVIQASTFNDNNENSVSTNELTTSPFSIFPNPAKEVIYISLNSLDKLEGLEIAIYNHLGQTVSPYQKMHSSTRPLPISVANLPAGLYRVAIKDTDGFIGFESVVLL